MISPSCKSVMRNVTLLSAALALSLGSASAQSNNAHDSTSDSSSAIASANTESSSSSLQLVSEDGMPSLAAVSGASGAHGSGGGQYDRSAGRRNMYSHLTFEAGGGFSAPTEDSSPYITWGGNVTVGAGYRFNPMFSLMTEYQFIDDKLPGQIIAEAGATGGNDHIWSLTLDPVVDLTPKGRLDVYVTGGGGFYRKVTSFTDPQAVQYCTYYYCGITTQNVVVGHFSSNQGGWNVGAGIAHRFGGNMKLFAEARYLDVDSPAVTTQPNGLGTTTVGAGTKIIPVTFGVRW
jgi:opacity protein-like surface antigen